ncbi:MAG TPA: hypothetical protein VEI57_17190 [Nitrospirota bacterium]|nr:hypothetical protein [Nitrospirota bacterium]
MTQKRSGFLLNSKMLYIICLLGMISAISFVRVGSSYAATEDNDRTDFGLLMPAKEVVETTLVDILKNQTALGITRWVAGDGELWCLVTDGRKFFSGRWLPSRRLLFYKKAGDKLILNYEYETMDRFSSCYVMEESGGRLLTVWDSGGTHHIVIFAVVEKTLKVVLMTGSKAFPEIADLDNDGVAEILIWGRSYEVGTSAEGNIQGYKWQSAYIYKWDGSSYTMVRTVPWQTRLNALQKTSP